MTSNPTADTFAELLDKLDGVRLRGDQASARCPAHDDGKASLSVGRGRDGRVLITCHAGCTWQDVLRAAGVTLSGAFGEPYLEDEYVYTDAAGTPLYVVERWSPKAFKQRMADGSRHTPAAETRVLFNLPTLAYLREHSEHPSLYFVEGERDVRTLAGLGYAATTSLGGANKPWQPQYTDSLAGMHVVIVADNDAPGKRWAHAVAESIRTVATAVIVSPPASVKDVTELIESGYQLDALRQLPETLGETVAASEYEVERVSWVWPGRLPRGMFTLLEGDPGTGKSTLTAEILGCLTTGRPLPGMTEHPKTMRIAMLADEDPWNSVVVPRLAAAGADLGKVQHLKGIRGEDGILKPYSLADLPTLRHDLRRLRVDMLVIDPLVAYMGSSKSVDTHHDQDVRSILGPLVQMAEEDGITTLAIRHFTKGSLGGKAIYRGGGSIGFTGQARSILQTAEHPDGDGFILAVAKCNLAPLAPSLGYRLSTDPRRDVARVAWSTVPLPWSAQQLQDAGKPARAATVSLKDDAQEFLRELLSDGESRGWQTIVDAGREDGHSEHTLRRARGKVLRKAASPPGTRLVKWQLLGSLPNLPTAKSWASGQAGGGWASESSHNQPDEGWTPTSILSDMGLALAEDDETDVTCPLAHDDKVGKLGQASDAVPVCTVCGSQEAVATYDTVGSRCAQHSPLVFDS